MYMFATEKAKEIRKSLKAQGITAQMVSVTTRDAGYEERIDVKIKCADVDIRKVEEIAHQYQEIDRDERTGEILAGGNTFVFVRYTDDAFDSVTEQFTERAQKLIDEAKNTGLAVVKDKIYLADNAPGSSQEICRLRDERTYDRVTVYGAANLAKYLYKIENYDHI